MRLSDFIKAKKKPEPELEPSATSPEESVPHPFPKPEKFEPAPPAPSLTAQRSGQISLDAEITTDSIYAIAVTLVRTLFQNLEAAQGSAITFPHVLSVSKSLADVLVSQHPGLLTLADRATADHYLYGHCVNTAILAGATAMTLRWPREGIETMIAIGLIHDVGMTPLMARPDSDELPEHLQHTKNCLAQIPELDQGMMESALTIISQMHERENGEGFPHKLRGDQIHPYAKILGLMDTYESLTHPRPLRGRLIPHLAIKALLKGNHGHFDPNAIKALIDTVSLFPPGSYVKLNSGAIAKVIQTHSTAPTRPLIQILMDEEGQWPEDLFYINLLEKPMVHVTEALDELALPGLTEEQKRQLLSQRWWTR